MPNAINLSSVAAKKKATFQSAGLTSKSKAKKKSPKKFNAESLTQKLSKFKTKSQKAKETERNIIGRTRVRTTVTSTQKNSSTESGKGKGIKAFA